MAVVEAVHQEYLKVDWLHPNHHFLHLDSSRAWVVVLLFHLEVVELDLVQKNRLKGEEELFPMEAYPTHWKQ